MTRTFDFEKFILEYNLNTGNCITKYPDGYWTGCLPNKDDGFHAKLLGITDKEHRFQHELIHHLVGIYYYKNDLGSSILYKSARNQELPVRETEIEEWLVNGWTYYINGKEYDKGVLMDLEKVLDIIQLEQITKDLISSTGNYIKHALVI